MTGCRWVEMKSCHQNRRFFCVTNEAVLRLPLKLSKAIQLKKAVFKLYHISSRIQCVRILEADFRGIEYHSWDSKTYSGFHREMTKWLPTIKHQWGWFISPTDYKILEFLCISLSGILLKPVEKALTLKEALFSMSCFKWHIWLTASIIYFVSLCLNYLLICNVDNDFLT